MSEPVQSTFEEASRCPKYGEPGKPAGERPLQHASTPGAMIKMFNCDNSRCKWYTSAWTVQVNPNGTIPPAVLHRDRQFRPLPDDDGRTIDSLNRQLATEMGRNAEVHRR